MTTMILGHTMITIDCHCAFLQKPEAVQRAATSALSCLEEMIPGAGTYPLRHQQKVLDTSLPTSNLQS